MDGGGCHIELHLFIVQKELVFNNLINGVVQLIYLAARSAGEYKGQLHAVQAEKLAAITGQLQQMLGQILKNFIAVIIAKGIVNQVKARNPQHQNIHRDGIALDIAHIV